MKKRLLHFGIEFEAEFEALCEFFGGFALEAVFLDELGLLFFAAVFHEPLAASPRPTTAGADHIAAPLESLTRSQRSCSRNR